MDIGLAKVTVIGVWLGVALCHMLPAVAQDPKDIGIANFGKVSTNLYRGSQPTGKDLKLLADAGLKTVVDLRMTGRHSNKEAIEARRWGMRYIAVPMSFSSPSAYTIKTFLTIVSDPACQPVFVHCRQGADRTGTVVGIYHMLVDHWTFDQTYRDMRAHHFKPFLVNLKQSVHYWGTSGQKELSASIAQSREL